MLPFATLDLFLAACGKYHVTIKAKDKAYHALFNLKFAGNILEYISTFRCLHLTLANELSEATAANFFFMPLPTTIVGEYSSVWGIWMRR